MHWAPPHQLHHAPLHTGCAGPVLGLAGRALVRLQGTREGVTTREGDQPALVLVSGRPLGGDH